MGIVNEVKVQTGKDEEKRTEPEACDWVWKVVSCYGDSWKGEREECNLRSFLHFNLRQISVVIL